jgi:hypothetical protein
MSDPHGTSSIPIGTQVIGANGASLGTVREVYPHYLLVHEEGEHGDRDVPVHAIVRFEGGTLYVSVNRDSATAVDDEETAHRLNPNEQQ